jgi:hypothetical protein
MCHETSQVNSFPKHFFILGRGARVTPHKQHNEIRCNKKIADETQKIVVATSIFIFATST